MHGHVVAWLKILSLKSENISIAFTGHEKLAYNISSKFYTWMKAHLSGGIILGESLAKGAENRKKSQMGIVIPVQQNLKHPS